MVHQIQKQSFGTCPLHSSESSWDHDLGIPPTNADISCWAKVMQATARAICQAELWAGGTSLKRAMKSKAELLRSTCLVIIEKFPITAMGYPCTAH